MSPCGTSVIRQLAGVSEKYVTQVSGHPYINFAVLFSNPLIRKRAFSLDFLLISFVELIAGAADREIGTVGLERTLHSSAYKRLMRPIIPIISIL